MMVSWKHDDAKLERPLTFEQKVDLFYEQALGWQLHVADLVANGGTAFGEDGDRQGKVVSEIRHSGFAVLQICLSYFETIGRYVGESGGSRKAFARGLLEVFPKLATIKTDDSKVLVDTLYEDARCGLYHNVRSARVGLGFPPEESPLVYAEKSRMVVVSPERLPKALIAHLDRYRDALLDSSNHELRSAFTKQFDKDSQPKR
jgi:hypothetical protein